MISKKRINNHPRIALVYDRVNKWGGAERILLALHQLYPQAPLYTLVHRSSAAPWSKKFKLIPSFFNKIGFLQTRHELLAPFASLAFESFRFDQFDLVISLTSAEAKAVITKPQTLHLCYCLTPTRYLWGNRQSYSQDFRLKFLPQFIKTHLKNTDLVLAQRPDHYLAISQEVSSRIKKYYARDAQVIYPPLDNKFFTPIKAISVSELKKYYLVVSRLVSYKKIDLVIKAFNQINKNLIIVGIGAQEKQLKSIANSNITFKGLVSDRKLINLYQNAQAVIFPQVEDFGLVPLEAQAAGTPVIAFARGGALETIRDKQTGLFFKPQTSSCLIQAIKDFEAGQHQITPRKCRLNAQLFSESRFIANFSAKVKALWQKHQNDLNT